MKVLTNLNPTVRWFLLPFACIISPILSFLIVTLVLIIWTYVNSGVMAKYGAEPGLITTIITFLIQGGIMGLSISQTALHLCPSHTRKTMRFVRIIGVISIILLYYNFYTINLLNILYLLAILAGLLIPMPNEEEIINQEESYLE